MIGQMERDLGKKVITGVFGADMRVDILNDGPVTIIIDTRKKEPQAKHRTRFDQVNQIKKMKCKMKQITFGEAQNLVDEWIRSTGVRYFSELTNMAILAEEVGEVARLMSRIYGDQSFREVDKDKKLSDELADVLWVILCIANQTGTDLTDAMKKEFREEKVLAIRIGIWKISN